jgi:hypothetical protein
MVNVGRTDGSDAVQPFPDDAPAPAGGSATPEQDTSNAAVAQQQGSELVQSLPAPVARPVAAAVNRRWLFLLR